MGSNLAKTAGSKDGSVKTVRSSLSHHQTDELSVDNDSLAPPSVGNPNSLIDSEPEHICQHNSTEYCVMFVLYDFVATLDSQLTVKRGECVRLLGYSPASDWSEVEALSHLPPGSQKNNYDSSVWNQSTMGYIRGWVPTSYLTRVANNQQASQQQPWTLSSSEEYTSTTTNREAASLSIYPWYHGAVSRQAGEQLLRSGITGSYLVRESESSPGQLSVTVRHSGRVYHYRISRDSCGWFFITETHRFPTVVQLIKHHSQAADGLICSLVYPAAKKDIHNNNNNNIHHSGQPHLLTLGGVHGGLDMVPQSPALDDWEIDRSEIMMRHKLGWGQYGDVYEALWKRYNSVVAVKTLKQDVNLNLNDFLAEAAIMKNLQHKNLVRLLGVCTREPPYYIVTEYILHGNLLNYLRLRNPGELTPPILLYMAVQIAAGMAYLEANNFIHRDLAARNCLVGESHTIKVADFGLARCMQLNDTYTARNGAKFPIKWTAPEGLAYFRFSSKSDVWAFGVVLWELATYGLSPYPGVELHGVYQLLERGYRMERPHGCPEAVYTIMLRCWNWEASNRPSFGDIREELEKMRKTVDMNAVVALELSKPQSVLPNSNSSVNNVNGQMATSNHSNQPQQFRDPAPLPYPSSPQFGRLPGLPQQQQHPKSSLANGVKMQPKVAPHAYTNRSGHNVKELETCRREIDDDIDSVDADDEDDDEYDEEEATVSCGKPPKQVSLGKSHAQSPSMALALAVTQPQRGQWPDYFVPSYPQVRNVKPPQGHEYIGDYRRAASELQPPVGPPSHLSNQLSAPASFSGYNYGMTPSQGKVRNEALFLCGVSESPIDSHLSHPNSTSSNHVGVVSDRRSGYTANGSTSKSMPSATESTGGSAAGESFYGPWATGGGKETAISFSCTEHPDGIHQIKNTITPAESGVGESIVSTDSPGNSVGGQRGVRGQRQQAGANKHCHASTSSSYTNMTEAKTPTNNATGFVADNHDNAINKALSYSAIVDNADKHPLNRLDAEVVTKFSTLPPEDRITQYLKSIDEHNLAEQPSKRQTSSNQPDPDPPLIFPNFPPPPPPPIPFTQPPAACRYPLRKSASDCYQTINTEKPPELELDKMPPKPLEQDVYQAPHTGETAESLLLTERLNDLSMQAEVLSSSCPQLTAELSTLSNQLATCRQQIESRLRVFPASNNSNIASDACLLSISKALKQIQQALSNMKCRVETLSTSHNPNNTNSDTPLSA